MPAPLCRRASRAIGLALAICLARPVCAASDPFLDEVVQFTPGEHAGFGQDQLPGIVLGPPVGFGALQGSTHTLSLGNGGSVVVRFDDPAVCDGPGADFIIFENAFFAGSLAGPLFIEVGIVAVSADGIEFVEFPYDATTFAGLAGRTPVYSAPGNGIDPLDPAVAGGDAFDLADIGLASIRYVRITDPGAAIPDPGNRVVPGNSGGFDLDAIAALHTCDAGGATATPSRSPSPSPSPSPTTTAAVTATITAAVTTTATASAPATPTMAPATASPTLAPTSSPTLVISPTPTTVARTADLDRDGHIDESDLRLLVATIFGSATAAADINGDDRISAADCVGLVQQSATVHP